MQNQLNHLTSYNNYFGQICSVDVISKIYFNFKIINISKDPKSQKLEGFTDE